MREPHFTFRVIVRWLKVSLKEWFLSHFYTQQTVFHLEVKTKDTTSTCPEKEQDKQMKQQKLWNSRDTDIQHDVSNTYISATILKKTFTWHIDEASRCFIGYAGMCQWDLRIQYRTWQCWSRKVELLYSSVVCTVKSNMAASEIIWWKFKILTASL